MTSKQRIIYAVLSSLCLLTGMGLFLLSDLPDRAKYTGFVINAELGYVAPEIGHRAPPFQLSNIDFEIVNLEQIKQEVVIINFWATWCVPCRIEMPELQNLYDRYTDTITILGINLGESPQSVAQWVEEFDLSYDILLDPLQAVAELYQLRGQPSTYIIDKDGAIRYIYYGPVSMETLERHITTLLD